RQVPFEKTPEALEDRARELVRGLGYTEAPADTASGFAVDADYPQSVAERDRSPRRWGTPAMGQPAVLQFWYPPRPRPRVATRLGRVYPNNPPLTESGMTGARYDMQGRLLSFYAVPPQLESAESPTNAPDWSPLFAQARLDLARFRPAPPRWT